MRVRAAGLNFADIVQIAGNYQVKPPLPFTPGLELAGDVLEIGEGVTDFSIGDRVAGYLDHGAMAEECIVPASMCFQIPDAMDYATASSFIIANGTSHIALEDRGQLKAGETLLVHGAAGGVGLTAVQIGKRMGATVIATASTPEKLAIAEANGADHLINYREQDFRTIVKELTNGKGADVIYDPVGGDTFLQSMRCINWRGRLLVIGFASGKIPQAPVNYALVKNFSIVGVHWGAYSKVEPQVLRDSISTLMDWYTEGSIKPFVSETYPLEDYKTAINQLAKRKARGRVVLTID